MLLTTSSSKLRLQLAHLLRYMVFYCAVWSAEHLRHTSLKARVRACAVYASDPLEPSPLTCPTARLETGFVLTFELPLEGSWWSKLGFGFIFSNFVWCLTKIGQGSLVVFCICVESKAVLCYPKLLRCIKPTYHEVSEAIWCVSFQANYSGPVCK